MAVVDEDRRDAGLGVGVRRQAADVPAVAHRDQGQHRDLPVLERVQRAEQLLARERLRRDQVVQLVPQRASAELDRRQVERLEVDHLLILKALALVAEHRLRVHDLAEGERDAERLAALEQCSRCRSCLALGLREVVAVERLEHRPAASEVELEHQVRAPEVEVDRRPRGRSSTRARLDRAEHLARGDVDQDEAVRRGRAQRRRGPPGSRRRGPARTRSRARAGSRRSRASRRARASAAPRIGVVVLVQRRLVGGAQQVLGVDLRVAGSRIAASTGRSRNSSGWRQKNWSSASSPAT